jgi:anti-sigma-K factor RskA
MSDVGADCPEVEALAAELALGIVSGSERAAALAHLNHCASCRRLVDELSAVADPLLLLAPEAEPSIGFESRVLAATTAADAARPAPAVVLGRRRRRFRTAWMALAAALVVLVVGFGGLLLGRSMDGGGEVRTALAVTANGAATCRAFAYGDRQAWVFVSLDAPPAWTADYTVEVTTEGGGRAAAVGQFHLQNGSGSLGTTVDVPASHLRAVRVLDASGALRYEANFRTA